MSNFTTPPTLRKLISERIKEKGLTLSKLVQAIGYKNVVKGIRRLDTYLNTFKAPSDDFVRRLLLVLDIDGLSFHNALTRSVNKMHCKTDRKAKEHFRPYLELSVKLEMNPSFAAYMLRQKYCVHRLPSEIRNLPFHEELDFVLSVYQEKFQHMVSNLSHPAGKKLIDGGFIYFRHYNSYLRFNAEGVLLKTVSVQPVPDTKQPFGNRVFNLLAGNIV